MRFKIRLGSALFGSKCSKILSVFLLFALIHIDPPIHMLGSYVSSIPILVLLLILFVVQKKALSSKEIVAIYILILYLLVSLSFTPGMDVIDEKLKSVLQLAFGVVSFLLAKKLDVFSGEYAKAALIAMVVLLLIGVVAELVIPSFQQLSDSVRELLFPEYYLYQADSRDIGLSGMIRPKVFASEPSHVVKTFFLISTLLMYLSRSKLVCISCIALSLFLFFIYQSPMVAGIFAVSILRYTSLVVKKYYLILVAPLITIIVISCFAFGEYELGGRFEGFSQSHVISSENIRIYFPFVTALDVVRINPILGAGAANEDAISRVSSLRLDYNYLIGNNSIAKIIIFYGMSGFLLFVLFLFWQLNGRDFYGVLYLVVFVFFWCFMSGGVDSIKFWISMGLLFSLDSNGFKNLLRRNMHV